MAPSKSAPQTRRNLMKALKKNKSVGTVAVQNSSPESVKKKKPISTNLQKQLSKKRKRVEQPVPNKQEGIKLLKRGAVTMHRIVRRKILGIKLPVQFNSKGEPYGDAAAEMQSYIGVLARTKPPICHRSWKDVPNERKNKIWDCVNMAFDVPETAKKLVWQSACQKWREFKSRLTTDYILPHRDQLELLVFPPADYSFIEKTHWDIFVESRLSNDFADIHDRLKKARAKSLYPHYMSRRGYANLEQELSQGDPEVEIDRSETWVLARKDKNGNYKSEEVRKIAEEMEIMKQRVIAGEVTVDGTDDILTKVLGSPEHAGRVRGQGTRVKQSMYFHLPKKRKKGKSIDEKIQERIQKFMAEETERIVRERDAFWAAEMAKLNGTLYGKNVEFNGSPNIGSQQGSCSKGAAVIGQELELQGVKKKLDLVHEKQVDEKTEVHEKLVEENTEVEEKNKTVENFIEVNDDHKMVENVSKDVVAVGTIDDVGDVLHAPQKQKKKKGKKLPGRKWKKVEDCNAEPLFYVKMDADYPSNLKLLWEWAKKNLKDGLTVDFHLTEEVFGSTKKQVLFLSDIHALCAGGEISGSTICIYTMLLQEQLKRQQMTDMITFVDPGTIGAKGCGSSLERSRALSIRFKTTKPGQIFLLPYHHTNHWALTAVNPDSQVAYHMDPLKRRIASEEWTEVVDNAIKLYKESEKIIVKKKITWENLAGVPLQSAGSTDCGVFVMAYMKEICQNKELEFTSKWARRSNLNYGSKDIYELKAEWAKFFMKHYVGLT